MLLLSQSLIASLATQVEIDLVQVIPVTPPPHFEFFKNWLTQGHDAGMAYLARRADERENVRRLMPEAQSIVVAGLVYKQSPEEVDAFYKEKGFKVAQYAWGKDYHKVFKEKLEILASLLRAQIPDCRTRVYVDTGPILERDHAALAGIGWVGKNTCLIHPKKGSFFFLGMILTSLTCKETVAPMTDHCGHCRACIDACPTDALRGPYALDATRCIAYWMIEHRGEFPEAIEAQAHQSWQEWIFGCDICQAVCPWNRKAPATTHAAFAQNPLWDSVKSAEDILAMSEETFSQWTKSPLKRTGIKGLQRNVRAIRGRGE